MLRFFLAALWGVCLYRAITQSITHDEALTYELYVAVPFGRMFNYFDANHHFLNTLLMRLSVALLGVSEWSVRLPALAGAGLYLAAVYQAGTRMFRTAAGSLLGVALITLNPFVLDFMVAARGYGMGLALFTYALILLVSCVRDEGGARHRRALLMQAGIALALSIAANLTFAVPVVVLSGIAVVWARFPRSTAAAKGAATPAAGRGHKKKPSNDEGQVSLSHVYRYLLIPLAAAGCLFFMMAPFQNAALSKFYVGAPGIAESLRSLASASLAYGGPLQAGHLLSLSVDAVALFIVPALLIGALTVGIRRHDAFLVFAAGTGTGSAILLFLAHGLAEVPYPIDRTGIYFLMLVPLSLAGLADFAIAALPRSKSAAALLCGVGLLLVVQFALQFTVTSFLTWKYDADDRAVVHRLAGIVGPRAPDSVTVGASWQLEPSLNFYRDKERLTWMRRVQRGSLVPGADFYVVAAMDRLAISALGLKPLAEWPLSGTTLAVPAAVR